METKKEESKFAEPKWYNMVGVWMMIIGGGMFTIIPEKTWWFFLILLGMGIGGYYLTVFEWPIKKKN